MSEQDPAQPAVQPSAQVPAQPPLTPGQKQGMQFVLLLAVVAGATWLFGSCGTSRLPERAPAAEIARQPERERLIADLVAEGVFVRVEGIRLTVGREFYRLPYERKENFVALAWAYLKTADPGIHSIVLRDGTSGKEIGHYTPSAGGLRLR